MCKLLPTAPKFRSVPAPVRESGAGDSIRRRQIPEQTGLRKMPSFLDLHTTPRDELRAIIDSSRAMKEARGGCARGAPDAKQPLKNRMVALIFEKPSTRTRVSFDLGVRQMGGQTMVLSGQEMQLGHGETIADTDRVLSRYVD